MSSRCLCHGFCGLFPVLFWSPCLCCPLVPCTSCPCIFPMLIAFPVYEPCVSPAPCRLVLPSSSLPFCDSCVIFWSEYRFFFLQRSLHPGPLSLSSLSLSLSVRGRVIAEQRSIVGLKVVCFHAIEWLGLQVCLLWLDVGSPDCLCECVVSRRVLFVCLCAR